MTVETRESAAPGHWRYRALYISVGLTAIGYLALSAWAGWRELLHAVASVGVVGTAVALGLSLVNYVLRFVRWNNYLRIFGHAVPSWQSLRIYMAGFALTTTPAKAGEVVRSVFLKRYGVTYSESLAAFFADRLCDLSGILLIAAIGLSAHAVARPFIIGLGGVVVLVLLILHNPRWLVRLEALGRHIRWRRVHQMWISLVGMVLRFRQCFTLPVMTFSMALSVVAWGAEASSFYLIATWMGADIEITEAWFIFAFSALVGVISFLPGGLGSTEAVMISLLLLNGMPEAQAIVCTLFVRVTTLWFAVVLGLIALPRKGLG
jgi:uncharacterized protein (TIRG00374 family)